jgi:hypothetical protein
MDKEYSCDDAHRNVRLDRAHVIREHMHALSGARLRVSVIPRDFKNEVGQVLIEPLLVSWSSARQKTISRYFITEDKGLAFEVFDDQKSRNTPPNRPYFKRDYQEEEVVSFSAKLAKNAGRYSVSQMQNLTKKIAQEFNMIAPLVEHRRPEAEEENYYGFAISELNKILMHTPNMAYVLHEHGHIIDDKIAGNTWVDHGPSFVRIFMFLAQRYMHFSPLQMEFMARECHLDVADLNAIPNAELLISQPQF